MTFIVPGPVSTDRPNFTPSLPVPLSDHHNNASLRMSLTFIHTADWQLGRPYASVEDSSKQIRLQQERIDCLARITALVKETNASFVLVAGDLLDSPSPTKATVSAACSALGKMGVPVIAIPGNHDHGGVGSAKLPVRSVNEGE